MYTATVQANKYRRLFQQHSVLDMLRLYIDISDEFLDEMTKNRLLTDDQQKLIKTLQWPASRNELLQILIRKEWTKDSYDKFFSTITGTQKQTLSEFLSTNLQSFKNSTESGSERQEKVRNHISNGVHSIESTKNPTTNLEMLLDPLQAPARMQVIMTLREKDEKIKLLTRKNAELETELQRTAAELDAKTAQNDHTEKLLDDWAAGLNFSIDSTLSEIKQRDGQTDQMERTLKDVRLNFSARGIRIAKLEKENCDLEMTVDRLTTSCRALESENAALLEERQQMKVKFIRSMEELKRSASVQLQRTPSAEEPESPSSRNSTGSLNESPTDHMSTQKSLTKQTDGLKKKKGIRKHSDVTSPAIAATRREADEKRRLSVPDVGLRSNGTGKTGNNSKK